MATDELIDELINDMLLETDKMALLDCKYGTPEYELQQDMIKHAARYRISKANKDKE